jgi:DNA (cytosine-5)-methyltransferase 1
VIYGSVCSGIEAATAAWHPLGWTPAFFSEIERFPSRVLAHHYPDTPNRGDMTRFKEWPDATIDVLVGGTPCQSFSVAGLRKGMADPRGNLALVYLALADRYRPRWLVWENVPGILSSNGGRDFGAFLGGLVELGYGFAYRVLDAQYFGLAQRRKRVFVVGHLGDWRRAAGVLFEPESLRGDSAPSREAGKGIAGTIAGGARKGGGYSTDDVPLWPADVACTLNAAFGDKQGLEDQHALGGGNCSSLPPVAMCLNAGAMGRQDAESETLIPTGGCFDVAHSLRGEGFDASEDGAGRGTPLVPVAFAQNSRSEVREFAGDGSIVGALSAEPGAQQQTYVAFSCKDHGADAGDVAPTLRSMTHDASHANGGGQVAVAFGWQNSSSQGDSASESVSPTLDKSKTPAIGGCEVGVRRLTPRECERLQGFADDFTLIPLRSYTYRATRKRNGRIEWHYVERCRFADDGPRYKALGNSMAVPVMAWIGRRIAEMDALELRSEAAA